MSKQFFVRASRNALMCAVLTAASSSAMAVTEVQFWHAMTGALGERVANLADQFNKSQSDYKVVAVYKGSYPDTLTAGVAAFRAGNAPHLLQVQEVATATMMNAKGAIVPVAQVMKEAGEKFEPKSYVPAVAGYYTSRKGEMLSFPFNSSTPVFYYNADAFEKAGLNPKRAPQTWPEVMAAAAKLKTSGASECAYSTGWQSWVHLETFSAWHNVPIASLNNGFDGNNAKLMINTPLHVKHISNMSDWAKKGYFTYKGRKSEAEAAFFSGECAMLTSSSAAYANIAKNAKFKFMISPLPYYADIQGAPQNTIIGGASLWVLGGKKKEEYKGVAKFLSFLSQPEVQATWHQETGYLPATMSAYEITKKSGFYDKKPGTDVSVKQMIVKTTDKSRGVRLGNMIQIRDVIDEELEGVWSGKQDAKTVLDKAVARGNEHIEKFAKTAKE